MRNWNASLHRPTESLLEVKSNRVFSDMDVAAVVKTSVDASGCMPDAILLLHYSSQSTLCNPTEQFYFEGS